MIHNHISEDKVMKHQPTNMWYFNKNNSFIFFFSIYFFFAFIDRKTYNTCFVWLLWVCLVSFEKLMESFYHIHCLSILLKEIHFYFSHFSTLIFAMCMHIAMASILLLIFYFLFSSLKKISLNYIDDVK